MYQGVFYIPDSMASFKSQAIRLPLQFSVWSTTLDTWRLFDCMSHLPQLLENWIVSSLSDANQWHQVPGGTSSLGTGSIISYPELCSPVFSISLWSPSNRVVMLSQTTWLQLYEHELFMRHINLLKEESSFCYCKHDSCMLNLSFWLYLFEVFLVHSHL